MKSVRKAVFPVGGLGTRFLPATKSIPKEMLTVVDKPLIQYAVEEAISAGIEQILFITGKGKTAIEDHFDHSASLELLARELGNTKILEEYQSAVPPWIDISYTRQSKPRGLGDAVLCARNFVGDEPFAILSADDFIINTPSCMGQLIQAYNHRGGNIIATKQVPLKETYRYGIVSPAEQVNDKHSKAAYPIDDMVEKPNPAEALSNHAIIGRYILQPHIFNYLENQKPGAGNEIQLTDAMRSMMMNDYSFHALEFEGQHFDCGSKLGLVLANVYMAYQRDDMRENLMFALQDL